MTPEETTLTERVANLLESGQPIPPDMRDQVHLALLLDIQQQVTNLSKNATALETRLKQVERFSLLLRIHKNPKTALIIGVIAFVAIRALALSPVGLKLLAWLTGAPFVFDTP